MLEHLSQESMEFGVRVYVCELCVCLVKADIEVTENESLSAFELLRNGNVFESFERRKIFLIRAPVGML